MLVWKECLNILQKQRAPSHATVPFLWFEGLLVSLATAYIYSALVYLATILFLLHDSWLSWHLLRCLVPNYCCPLIGDITAFIFISEVRLSGGANTLKPKAGESHFCNPALSIWPHSEFRAHPLSSILVTAQIWSPTCVCVCACESRHCQERGCFIPDYSSIEGHGNYYPSFKTFTGCFSLYCS